MCALESVAGVVLIGLAWRARADGLAGSRKARHRALLEMEVRMTVRRAVVAVDILVIVINILDVVVGDCSLDQKLVFRSSSCDPSPPGRYLGFCFSLGKEVGFSSSREVHRRGKIKSTFHGLSAPARSHANHGIFESARAAVERQVNHPNPKSIRSFQ